jgi:DNA ligase-4
MSAARQARRWEPVAPPPGPSNPGDGDGEVVLQDPAHVLPPPPPCHGEMPVFSVLTTLFEALANERKQDRRRGMLERWFTVSKPRYLNDEALKLKFATLLRTGVRTLGVTFILYFDCCSPKCVCLIFDHPCGLTFCSLPQKDRERSVYYLKEATIAKAFIAVMGIEKTPDAMALSHWKKPMPGQACSFILPSPSID